LQEVYEQQPWDVLVLAPVSVVQLEMPSRQQLLDHVHNHKLMLTTNKYKHTQGEKNKDF